MRFDVAGAIGAGMGAVWLRHDGVEPAGTAVHPDFTLETLVGAAPHILEVLASRLAAADRLGA